MNSVPTEPKSFPTKTARKKLPKKRILLLLLALLLTAAAAFGLYRLFFAKEERVAITGTTTFGALNEAIEGSGTTTPADSVSYDINGTVLEWLVEPGMEVQAGDLLYVLDSSEAEDEILENEVELEELYEQLADLQENISNQNVTAEFSGRIQSVQGKEGRNVQNGATLATLIDDSTMKATLYFSYIYKDSIRKGMDVTVSVPDQMMALTGSVTDIRYVDYRTPEGMQCFAVTVEVPNPGSLTEGTTVTCWLEDGNGGYLYSVDDATLSYNRTETVTAGASGELTAVNVVDYERVQAGQTLFVIDASGYENQIETVRKQIENYEDKIADLRESVATEYSRYADISGRVVSAAYSTNRMTGADVGSVVIYNQDSMEIAVNIDELDADRLQQGMEVTVYRTTSSKTEFYPATLSYLSLEATSGSSGVSTFAATITINSQGKLSSGVTVYYAIDPSGSEHGTEETVLAPVSALFSYDDGYYLLVQSEKKPADAIDPAEVGGSVTEYPDGYYAVPVEVGDYNGSYIQILSGVEKDATLFLRYMNVRPSGGDTTSDVGEEQSGMAGFPAFGEGGMPNFGSGNIPSGMPNFGGGSGGGMPSFGGGSGGMPSFGGGSGGGQMANRPNRG